MKRLLISLFFIASIALTAIVSCKKSINNSIVQPPSDSTANNSTPAAPYPQTSATECTTGPDYGDSIIHAQPTSGTDYFVAPVNNPGKGKYYSWPVGLSINDTTGVINVSASEAGEKYMIGFVKDGTSDTCMHPLIIGGSSYIDSIYTLDVSQYSAPPYFDANYNPNSSCNGCKFEVHEKNFGKELKVDHNTGVIALGDSYKEGIFGFIPFNGETIQTTIDYSLGNDKAIQHLQIRLIFYYHKSDIPASILNSIAAKRSNIMQDSLITTSTNPRPPMIIVVRNM